jgi:hypothetical protein
MQNALVLVYEAKSIPAIWRTSLLIPSRTECASACAARSIAHFNAMDPRRHREEVVLESGERIGPRFALVSIAAASACADA